MKGKEKEKENIWEGKVLSDEEKRKIMQKGKFSNGKCRKYKKKTCREK